MDETLIGTTGPHDLFGKACALLTAVTWASALICFKQSSDRINPLALNLFKNVIGLLLLAATIWLTAKFLPGYTFPLPSRLSSLYSGDLWTLILSGILGIAIADTLFLFSLRMAGVGIIAIVECMYTPSVVFFSWWILRERLTFFHYLGAALIVTAVFLAVGHQPPIGRTRRQIVTGVICGCIALALTALGIVIAKRVLDGAPVLWTTTIRLGAASIVLLPITVATIGAKPLTQVFRPSAIWKTAVPASILGAYLSMILWIAGFTYTKASIAGMLNQSATIIATLLAWLVLGERMTKRKLASVALALTGVGIVVLHRSQ